MLSEHVLRFLQSSVRSIWDLELLLVLQRDRARGWTTEELVRELRSSPLVVTQALLGLRGAGLLAEEPDGRCRYEPATAELDDMVRQLRQAYAEFPIAVAKAILSAPSDKIQVFADAFRLKKD